MGSPVALLRACYERLHGVHGEALRSFAKPHQKAWIWLKRSVDAVLDGRSESAAAQRHPIILVFDVVAGAFTKHMATAAAAASGEQHELEGGHCRRGSIIIRSEHPCVLGSGVLGAAPRVHTQRVCARVPPFRALVPPRRCPLRYEPAVRLPRRRFRAVHQRHARALPPARASPSTRMPLGVAHRPPAAPLAAAPPSPPPSSSPPPSPPPFSPPTPSPPTPSQPPSSPSLSPLPLPPSTFSYPIGRSCTSTVIRPFSLYG